MNMVEALELQKTYPGPVEAVRGISFEVRPGEIFGLLGPNGAGKSTTIRMLTTLTTPTAGDARVGGFSVLESPQEVRRRIGYVAQNSGVDALATGRENLSLQGRLLGVPARERDARVARLIDTFQLGDAADRIVRTWSGGMKRRLDLAMGLVHKPAVLFLDEPTTGLDPESRRVMWDEIRKLIREEQVTLLLTTHYLEEADQLAQRLAIVDQGRIVAEGTPDELKKRLAGDRVSVQLAGEDGLERGRDLLRQVSGVHEVLVDGSQLHAQVANGAQAVPAVLGALEAAGLRVASVSLNRPSLDDVYLAATGHTFQAASR